MNGLAGDALALISGVKDRDKYYEAERIQGRLKSEAYKYLVNKTLSTVGKIFSLKGRIEIFLNARERDKQKWINCVAEDNLVSLARFYRIANNRLWQIAQTKGQTGMRTILWIRNCYVSDKQRSLETPRCSPPI